MNEWIHPNHTSKGGPGDPLLEIRHWSKRQLRDRTHVSTREINCARCQLPGRCQVTFEYTEGGKIKSAEVTRLEDGWEYRPFGNVGGEAPYCAECLPKEGTC